MNKIDLNLSKHVEQQRVNNSGDASRAAQTEQPAKPAAPGSPSEPDAVKVSERAANVGRLAARAAELPDVRQEKVEALRERLQSGSYNPQASDIADAVIKEEK
ncbi:MAG TPA: flagellar biosynthesis anti-sigma factor FlgM [Pyrinomonadaceae bacterium]|nr:flagellar biosynthesis anti-sigma factor FlgM [Pyrinomonadaceae bacterium]